MIALISLRQVLDHATEHDYGVPAFNIDNMEQIHALPVAVAVRVKSLNVIGPTSHEKPGAVYTLTGAVTHATANAVEVIRADVMTAKPIRGATPHCLCR